MRNKSSIMMFLIMFLVIVIGVFYLGRRTAYIFNAKSAIFYTVYGLIIIGSMAIMMVGMSMRSLNPFLHALFIVGNSLVGILLYLLLTFILTDIINLFAHFQPKTFGILAFGIAFCVSAYALINAANPRVKRTDINVKNISKPTKIVHLTDIHLGHFRGKKNLEKIVDKTNAENPEFVVLTGDFFENVYNLNEETVSVLKQINAPVYFVDGNHDIYTDDMKIKQLVSKAGVDVLVNRMVEQNGIQIIGLDYMDADENSTEDVVPHASKSRTIRNTMPEFDIDAQKPTIVLHHSPIGGKFIAEAGANLYLAGHTHGGQLFPLTLINDHLFEFNKGLYDKYGMKVYVSCGTGTFGPPMRLGTTSEVAVLTLLPE